MLVHVAEDGFQLAETVLGKFGHHAGDKSIPTSPNGSPALDKRLGRLGEAQSSAI